MLAISAHRHLFVAVKNLHLLFQELLERFPGSRVRLNTHIVYKDEADKVFRKPEILYTMSYMMAKDIRDMLLVDEKEADLSRCVVDTVEFAMDTNANGETVFRFPKASSFVTTRCMDVLEIDEPIAPYLLIPALIDSSNYLLIIPIEAAVSAFYARNPDIPYLPPHSSIFLPVGNLYVMQLWKARTDLVELRRLIERHKDVSNNDYRYAYVEHTSLHRLNPVYGDGFEKTIVQADLFARLEGKHSYLHATFTNRLDRDRLCTVEIPLNSSLSMLIALYAHHKEVEREWLSTPSTLVTSSS